MSGKTIRGILSVLGGRFGTLLLGVLITPLLVRILGSAQYGDYAFLMSVFGIAVTFSHAGMSAGIRKYIAEDRTSSDWQSRVFSFYGRLGIILAIVVAGILIISSLIIPVGRYFGDNFRLYFLLLALLIVADQVFYISRYTLMGLHYESISEPLTVLKKAIFGIVGLSLAYIGYDIAGVLMGLIIAAFTAGSIAFWKLRARLNLQVIRSAIPDGFPRKELFMFNITNTVFILLTISLYNVDLLLLQPLVGSHETGIYKAALVVASFIWIAPRAIQTVFIHSSSKLWSQGRHDDITAMASKATRFTIVFTLLLILGIAALANEFMYLYFGSEFTEGVIPLLLLLPGVLGFAIARPIFAIGQGKGALRTLIIGTGAAALINLILNLLLIPRYGVVGAAVATSIGYGSMVVFHTITASWIGYNPFSDHRIGRIALTVLIATPFIFVPAYIIESRLLALSIVPPIGLFSYSIIALRLRAIDASEVQMLTAPLPQQLSLKADKIIRVLA